MALAHRSGATAATPVGLLWSESTEHTALAEMDVQKQYVAVEHRTLRPLPYRTATCSAYFGTLFYSCGFILTIWK